LLIKTFDMPKKITLILFILILNIGQFSKAQTLNTLTPRDEEFLAGLRTKLESLDRQQRSQAQFYLDTFAAIWTSGTLLENQKEWVHTTMDQFSTMRLRPWPDYALYLEGVVKILRTHEPDVNFDVWHQSFQGLLNTQNQRRLISYWEKSIRLFEKNIIYSSSAVEWKLTDPRYKLSFYDQLLSVEFGSGNIICYSQKDSLVIYNTQGRVYLMDDKLQGRGGKLTWERVLLDPERVYAQLGNYNIDLTFARIQADSVMFYNLDFFPTALAGKVDDRILAEVKPENSNFPRFESYMAIHEINNIFPGINFRGGFTMAGQRVLGSGTADGDATLKFYRADSLFVAARSRLFSIRNDRIVADRAAVSIYLSGDSIFHPSIATRYLHETRELSLQRDEKGTSRAPFFNSFHKLDMYCEAINWNIDEYDMELRMIRGMSSEGTAIFESQDYFSDLRYMRMQALSGLHPLIRLRNFSTEYNSHTFPINEYAQYISSDISNVKGQLISFSHNGFLSYNEDNETVTLHDKLFHYIGAYVGRNDFDVIRINSVAPVNARINMNNFDLHLMGVERIPLSNEKNVVIHPNNKEVIMKKNRDIFFDGRIESGLFDFFGKEFFFDYDQFKINLVNTDSMSFRVRSFEPDSRGNYAEIRVRTVLEGINGELLVDHPRNKSGRLPYPRYPIFSSDNESYVYYDREFVQSGVYQRENVYFKLIPFSIDSLDNATTDNIAFDGVFISTGIFPDFYDYLTVQKDYSLGFNTKTPPDGYTVYGGKALYKGPIDMSYEGLRTDGELQYLNATIHANQMLMFPDSARALVNSFALTAQSAPIEYPEVKARDVNMIYKPFEDHMNLSKTIHAIDMYAGIAHMHGSIRLSPEGLKGSGSLNFSGAELASAGFDFKRMDFEAENSALKLLTRDGKQSALEATKYNVFVDFAAYSSNLKAIDKSSQVAFNINRFDGFGYDFDWDMQTGKLKMENTLHAEISSKGLIQPEQWIAMDFSGYELVSNLTARESLGFYAGLIDYNIDDNVIHAREVKLIKVADAAIFPDNEEVFILQQAEIKKLENTYIVANTSTMHHRFYNADATIASRRQFAGSGMYDFVDKTGRAQPISFETIRADRNTHTTVAQAKVEKADDFTLSPRFGFIGELNLTAENPNFYYNGAAQIIADCGLLQSNWVKFESELKVDSIFIPIGDDLRNEANGSVRAALMLAGDSIHIYPAILSRQKHYSDMEIISAEGFLTYDNFSNEYIITTGERFQDNSLEHNIIRINPNTCMLNGEGDINIVSGLGQFKVNTFGSVSHNLAEEITTLDLVMGLNFFFLNPALGLVENSIKSREELETVNLNRRKYSAYLQKKTGGETATRLIDEYILTGSFRRFPPELENTFFLADIKLKWDQDNTTFHSTGPIGIGSMERFPMNRYLSGFLEIKKQRGGDIFNMIFIPSGMADEGIGVDWYFFHYSKGIMQTIASDTQFNTLVREVNPRRRRMDVERGEEPYTFVLSSDRRPFDFVRSMRDMLP
jgi:hypothetical protein